MSCHLGKGVAICFKKDILTTSSGQKQKYIWIESMREILLKANIKKKAKKKGPNNFQLKFLLYLSLYFFFLINVIKNTQSSFFAFFFFLLDVIRKHFPQSSLLAFFFYFLYVIKEKLPPSSFLPSSF